MRITYRFSVYFGGERIFLNWQSYVPEYGVNFISKWQWPGFLCHNLAVSGISTRTICSMKAGGK